MTTEQRIKPAILLETPEEKSSEVFVASIRRVQEAAEQLEVPVFFSNRDPIERDVWVDPELRGRPVIAYGSVQFIRDIKDPIFPGAYGYAGTDWLTMTAHVPRKWLLNSDFMMTSWGDLKRNFEWWSDKVDPKGLFVRPSSDKKVFAAQVIPRSDWQFELNQLDALSSVMPETLCVVSPVHAFGEEYRFWIVDRKVVGSSYYPTYGVTWTEHKPFPDQKLRELADKVAQLEWQPDACYTVDLTCDSNGNPKIVEMNSFCCSGVYDSDFVTILEAVVDQSSRDFYPE